MRNIVITIARQYGSGGKTIGAISLPMSWASTATAARSSEWLPRIAGSMSSSSGCLMRK